MKTTTKPNLNSTTNTKKPDLKICMTCGLEEELKRNQLHSNDLLVCSACGELVLIQTDSQIREKLTKLLTNRPEVVAEIRA